MAKKVFLSAGHGGKDPGACAYGMKESNINLVVMLACRDELKRHGVIVVCSRTKDENDPVAEEVREANASEADIAVSFHVNAGKGNGSETFYYKGDANGLRLAQLCEKYTKQLGQNSRGVKDGSHLYFVNGTKMTAALCEIGFIDNDTDNDIFDTTAEQKAFGVAYAKAILEHLGITYMSGNTSTNTSASAANKTSTATSSTSGSPTYKVGKAYTLQVELKVRKGAGTNYAAKKYSELTANGKKCDKDKDGALDKGTQVTCKAVKKVGSDVWIQCPSGWLAAYYNGNVYIK